MTQQKLDGFFSLTPSSTRSGKRSRTNQVTTNDRDEFDDLFETTSSMKRRRTNNNNTNSIKPSADVSDFDLPSTSSTTKKSNNEKSTGSLKKKRSFVIDDDENKVIDELFNNDTRKKLRRPIKQEESSSDLLDMFKTRKYVNIPQSILTTIEVFKTPICPKNATTQKKIKMFFDDTDLTSLREQTNEQNDVKDYVHIQPVLVTGGQWLSKEAETKSTCETIESSTNPITDNNIPDDQRNLMHIQYASLIVDDEIDSTKPSKGSKRSSLTRKPSRNSTKTVLDGKSFHKQLVLSDSAIVRKENLRSCYNALLEDINKPRLPTSSSSSNKQKKSATSKSSKNDEIIVSDDEDINNIDFFDLPTRKKKF